MTNVLDISNIINVSVTDTPSGLTETNINSLGLFTTETPSNADPFRIYVSASQVAEDFGTDSVTAAMANNIFSQSPNILSGNGRLVIMPLQSSVSAKAGDFVTTDISGNISNFQAVTDGTLRVTLNGTDRDILDLDFSAVNDLDDIASIINDKLPDVSIEASATALTFTSKKVGSSSSVALTGVGSGTDISGAGFLEQSNGTGTGGSDATGETLVDAIQRLKDKVSFVGVITNLDMEDAVIETTAAAIQSQDRIFLHHFGSTEDLDGVITTITDAGQTKTRPILYLGGLDEANLCKSSYAGKYFAVNVNGSATAKTMQLKELTNVQPDPFMSQTIFSQSLDKGADIYASLSGVPSVSSSGANDFSDNIYMNLALKFALETAGFNYLRQTNTKIPQTEAGMNGLKSTYRLVLERFVINGFIGEGLTWNSSETFGNPEVFRESITNKGYYVYSLPIAQQSQTEREQRKAPLVQIAVKRAGAIHTGDVLVIVND